MQYTSKKIAKTPHQLAIERGECKLKLLMLLFVSLIGTLFFVCPFWNPAKNCCTVEHLTIVMLIFLCYLGFAIWRFYTFKAPTST